MSGSITIPFWLFLLLSTIAILMLVQRYLFPGIRWFFRKKINHAIDELNERLNIKIRPFQLTKRQVLLDRLIHDPKVLDFVHQQSIDDEVPRQVLMEKVQRYAREIVPAFNAYIYYRLAYWLSKKLAMLLYKVRVKTSTDKFVKQMDPNATIVFVMNHRSNMDYILVSFLVSKNMTLSYAVGEWARVWPLQGLIKSMGAYFVRRNSRNPLYRRVLERYIAMATKEGVCQAVFPEGGLSRDGRIRAPKLGFLDYMLRNYHFEKDRDVIFVPVGINYDRVLEDRTLLRSLNPNAESRSNWFSIKTTFKFWRHNMKLARKHQWKRFGYASVSFSQPISCKEYCENHGINFSKLESNKRFEQVAIFADQLMHEIEKAVPIVPLVLIASILVDLDGQSITGNELKLKARELIQLIEQKGGQILFPNPDKWVNLEGALEMLLLRRLVEKEVDEYRVAPESEAVLDYYRNSIAHWLD
ncbi:MAG: 1-acyl-sn-glycerol-3-phosphate acyltransferase [Enterobacterales bacterium]|nr:1-acyl-sn-glycerol-3-phosphate acyltransferase [Enterobacterales bacterium]